MNNIRQGWTTLEMARVHMDALALCYEVVELAENLERHIETSKNVELYPKKGVRR
jgi:hypothetical protein